MIGFNGRYRNWQESCRTMHSTPQIDLDSFNSRVPSLPWRSFKDCCDLKPFRSKYSGIKPFFKIRLTQSRGLMQLYVSYILYLAPTLRLAININNIKGKPYDSYYYQFKATSPFIGYYLYLIAYISFTTVSPIKKLEY